MSVIVLRNDFSPSFFFTHIPYTNIHFARLIIVRLPRNRRAAHLLLTPMLTPHPPDHLRRPPTRRGSQIPREGRRAVAHLPKAEDDHPGVVHDGAGDGELEEAIDALAVGERREELSQRRETRTLASERGSGRAAARW